MKRHPSRSPGLFLMTCLAAVVPHTVAYGQLAQSCTATVAGRTVQTQSGGTFAIPNVPVHRFLYRVRLQCAQPDGTMLEGQSRLMLLSSNGPTQIPRILLTGVEPVTSAIRVTAAESTLSTVGSTTQVTA